MAHAHGPFLQVTWTDPVTGRHGFLVIDRLVRGLAGGGTRVRARLTLDEVSRLATAMSLKNGVLAIPAGGAKCGIDCDPHDAEAMPMLRRFVRAMYPLWDSYVATGEDMGVQQSTLNAIFADLGLGGSMRAALRARDDFQTALETSRTALSLVHEGRPLVDLVGGFGVAAATRAALGRIGQEVRGARVVIQGFGSMGASTARYLASSGATVVGVADVRGLVVNEAGLDVPGLLAATDAFGTIDRGALRGGDRQLDGDEWVAIPCDVLVPAAVADAINPANCERVKAPLVVEAANLPTSARAESRLVTRGVTVVPDFVANAATNAWAWWLSLGLIGPSPDDAFRRIGDVIPAVVAEVLDRSDAEHVSPREAATRIAIGRLDQLAAEHGEESALRLAVL